MDPTRLRDRVKPTFDAFVAEVRASDESIAGLDLHFEFDRTGVTLGVGHDGEYPFAFVDPDLEGGPPAVAKAIYDAAMDKRPWLVKTTR